MTDKTYRPAKIAPREGTQGPRRGFRLPRQKAPKKALSSSKVIILVVVFSVSVLFMQSKWIDRNKEKFTGSSVSRFFKQLFETQHFDLGCPHCRGTGLVGDEEAGTEALCPICLGTGSHHVRLVDLDEVICAHCQGMGRRFNPDTGEAEVCPECGGRGVLPGVSVRGMNDQPAHILQIECDVCVGNGFVRDPATGRPAMCPVCFGLGYAWVRDVDDHDNICPACGGMGRVRDPGKLTAHVCGRCGGRGMTVSDAAEPADDSPTD